MLLSQALFVFLLFFQREVYSVEIPCTHSTPVCECDINNLDDGDDVCEFQFDIEMLQTFTRYVLDDNGDSRGTAGSVWQINNGRWQPVNSQDTSCGTTIGDKKCTEPFGVDGYTFRSFIAVNGRIPGPTLIVPQNKLVKVNVTNRLASESISIHWHGMHQRKTNWMDGVEHITQCGIPPGASFTYIFEAAQYGTHWYHSHSGAQRTDGLFGALIVKDNQTQVLLKHDTITSMNINDYEDMPDKHTLSLLDWQKTSSLDLFTQIHSGIRYFDIDKAASLSSDAVKERLLSPDGAEIGPVPYWSGLINGKGKHRDDVDYVNSNLSEFKVTAGTTYRFRLIGAQSLYAYRFSIEEHNLTVIATDGQFIEPIEVDYIIIHSGERYDFLLKTKATPSAESRGYFMIRAITLNFTETTTYLQDYSAEAILNYNEESTPSSRYSAIAMRSQTVSQRCADHTCKALNCPFKQFPMDYNIECIHIDTLTLLTEYSTEDLPEIATEGNSRLFFNFAFEGTRQTSAVNARNLKLPSGAIALLDTTKLADIKDKEFCKGLNEGSKCDRENDREVISPGCYCTHVKTVEADRSIELVLSAIGPQPTQLDNFLFAHPVHLHGHYFHVLDIQFGTTDENTGRLTAGHSEHIDCGGDILCTVPSWKTRMDYNTRKSNEFQTKISRAPLKDTLLIPAGGYAVVYFKADNPGWWFLHCHIEVHQLEGMGVIINEGGSKTSPPGGMNKCGNFSFTTEEFNTLRNTRPNNNGNSGSGGDNGNSGSGGDNGGKSGNGGNNGNSGSGGDNGGNSGNGGNNGNSGSGGNNGNSGSGGNNGGNSGSGGGNGGNSGSGGNNGNSGNGGNNGNSGSGGNNGNSGSGGDNGGNSGSGGNNGNSGSGGNNGGNSGSGGDNGNSGSGGDNGGNSGSGGNNGNSGSGGNNGNSGSGGNNGNSGSGGDNGDNSSSGGDGQVSKGYKTATIVLSVALGLIAIFFAY